MGAFRVVRVLFSLGIKLAELVQALEILAKLRAPFTKFFARLRK